MSTFLLYRMQMSENKGYQILGMLLRKKIPLLNAHILHLMFTMAGTIDSGRDTNEIQNIPGKLQLVVSHGLLCTYCTYV